MTSGARIAGLFVYPVKGCAGIELDDAQLTARGLAHDRRWMVVTPAGRFQSQRELPQLATLRPTLTDGKLRLALDDANQIAVPIADVGEPLRVTVWRDAVDGPGGRSQGRPHAVGMARQGRAAGAVSRARGAAPANANMLRTAAIPPSPTGSRSWSRPRPRSPTSTWRWKPQVRRRCR